MYYTQPTRQRRIVRVILMVPIYALSAFIGNLFINRKGAGNKGAARSLVQPRPSKVHLTWCSLVKCTAPPLVQPNPNINIATRHWSVVLCVANESMASLTKDILTVSTCRAGHHPSPFSPRKYFLVPSHGRWWIILTSSVLSPTVVNYIIVLICILSMACLYYYGRNV